jgi:hypothetical protein
MPGVGFSPQKLEHASATANATNIGRQTPKSSLNNAVIRSEK